MTKKEKLQAEAKDLEGYNDSLTIPQLEELLAAKEVPGDQETQSNNALKDIEVVDAQEEAPVKEEEKIYEGEIDMKPFTAQNVDRLLSDFRNQRPLGKERLEALVRKCIVA
jgi:hypothetical protein